VVESSGQAMRATQVLFYVIAIIVVLTMVLPLLLPGR
jgi:predicted nucleic acid-binding Zn ribbon protein